MKHYKAVIIGGGIAGICAALELVQNSVTPVLLIERETNLGGILNQCIHTGFGLKYLGENRTGPEYLKYFTEKIGSAIDVMVDTEVIEITPDKVAILVNRQGLHQVGADAVIFATGCIERHLGQVLVNGNRVAGIYTAGTAQRIINLKGGSVGKRIVILGSGNVGLITARRFTLTGVTVVAVVEKESNVAGLERNQIDCIDAYQIPLLLNHTVTTVFGNKTVTAVGICPVRAGQVIFAEETIYECDALITSMGLIPDVSLAQGQGLPGGAGFFYLGNCHYVHDLADNISIEAERLAQCVSHYLATGEHRSFATEQSTSEKKSERERCDGMICTICPEGCHVRIENGEPVGNRCDQALLNKFWETVI